ncbi:MAG: hypothetical protein A3J52_02965 [Omnitrophica bacterium RIFCSPHIGHO2_02_FULL_49_9]|nr:MAG: hypothetical protein A3J52_02965 [Omnitrophica bacterium RIFCSPHIGHO2_02_FULL_49_9]
MVQTVGFQERKPLCLKGYDYSIEGLYFVTICVQNRIHLFGNVVVGADQRVGPKIALNSVGEMIQSWWEKIPGRFANIGLDPFVIMPNHIHGIIAIQGRTHGSAPTLARMIQWFKTMTTNDYIRGVRQHRWAPFAGTLWQRSYYEHIVRNEDDLNQIRQYILDNHAKWEQDSENVHP